MLGNVGLGEARPRSEETFADGIEEGGFDGAEASDVQELH